jgi:ribosomal protein L11 methyltransferase
MDQTAPWLELSFDATAEAVDWVRSLLSTTPYTGTLHLTPYVEPDRPTDESDPPTPWAFTIYLYLPNDTQVRSQLDDIAQQLSPLHRTGLTSELQTAILDEMPSVSAALSPLAHRVGQRFVVRWLAGADQVLPDPPIVPESADDIVLNLPPSLAFGSGLHPATVLSLRLLEQYVQPWMHTLDLGCGSGILSVAIAKLGAQVLAVDNDAIAVQATTAAVQQNGVALQVTVRAGSLGSGSQMGHWMGGDALADVPTVQPAASFDLIAANILARVHIALAPDLRRSLRLQNPAGHESGGLLIAAGFTAEYEADVAAAFVAVGFEAVGGDRLNEWVALAYRLKAE